MEQTNLALWLSACITDLLADIGWFAFQSRYPSVCVGFLNTVVWVVWLELKVHLVSQEGDASFIVRTFQSELYVVI